MGCARTEGWSVVSTGLALVIGLLALAAPVRANDLCAEAQPIHFGNFGGTLTGVNADGSSSCDTVPGADVWFRFAATETGPVAVRFGPGTSDGLSLSVHTDCPGSSFNQITCARQAVVFDAEAGEDYWVRVGGSFPQGEFGLVVRSAGSVSGRVTDLEGNPIPELAVRLEQPFNSSHTTLTDAEGRYQISTRGAGRYWVSTEGGEGTAYRDEVYDNLPCESPGVCPFDVANELVLADEEEITNIDFQLDRLGQIRGRVTHEDTHEVIPSAIVDAGTPGIATGFGFTDADGEYTLSGLHAGEYTVWSSAFGFLTELWQEIPCPLPCFVDGGTPVEVDYNQVVEGVDFTLAPLASLRGRVVSADGGEPLPFERVEAIRGEFIVTSTFTDSEGEYELFLEPGTYAVLVGTDEDLLEVLHPDIPCYEGCDFTSGSRFELELGERVEGVDFAVARRGEIHGRVVDAGTGAPMPFPHVAVFNASGGQVGSVTSFLDGTYQVEQLAPGTFTVRVGSRTFQPQLWQGLPCPGSNCDPTTGTPLVVEPGGVISGINFALRRLGTLEGRVVDEATGLAVPRPTIDLYGPEGLFRFRGRGETDGRFVLDFLEPGTYTVVLRGAGYFTEVYPDLRCPGGPVPDCDLGLGVTVEIELGSVNDLGTLDLDWIGSIEGSVRDVGGVPIVPPRIELFGSEGQSLDTQRANSDGSYAFLNLSPGLYYVAAGDGVSHLPQVWPARPCSGICDPTDGKPIRIEVGRRVKDIDFTLQRPAVIEGSVIDSEIGAPVPTSVSLWQIEGGILRGSASVDAEGRYRFIDIEPGDYVLYTSSFDQGYVDRFHDGTPCAGLCQPGSGPVVSLGIDSFREFHFVLDPQQGVSGRVLQEGTGAPISDLEVEIWDASGERYLTRRTDRSGRFLIPLPLGEYYLSTRNRNNLFRGLDEVYPDAPCIPPNPAPVLADYCDPFDGEPIRVKGNSLVRDLNFQLEGILCESGPVAQCLEQDRFRVSVTAVHPDGQPILAESFPLTEDTAGFTFFDPENLEVVVKVVNTCGSAFDSFWVFAAGLTGLETRIEVFDTWSRESREYTSEAGTPFALVRDTRAFETCDVGGEAGLATPTPESVATHSPAAVDAGCAEGDETLCLAESRFRLEVEWRTEAGEEGRGQAVPLGGDSGYFWFFGPQNVEIIAKVIDACTLEPFNSFWFFAAGLTDVETRLVVTDTVSGEQKIYTNPLGNPFEPILDLRAFETCSF